MISKFERKEVHGQSITSSEHSSRKSINELEQEDPINEFRPVNVMRVKRNFNQLEYGNNPMKIGSDQNKEFIPLYSTKYQREYSRKFPENTRALKYHFPSTKPMKNPS